MTDNNQQTSQVSGSGGEHEAALCPEDYGYKEYIAAHKEYIAVLSVLSADVQAAQEALRKDEGHLTQCRAFYEVGPCSCGFDAPLKEGTE